MHLLANPLGNLSTVFRVRALGRQMRRAGDLHTIGIIWCRVRLAGGKRITSKVRAIYSGSALNGVSDWTAVPVRRFLSLAVSFRNFRATSRPTCV